MELDEVDRGILHMLQEDARKNSASVIAEQVGVAPNTVRNRIRRLEQNDVIDGYNPHINYDQAGYQLNVIFLCTVPISQREEFAEEVLSAEGVVHVIEVLSGRDNLAVEVVCEDSNHLTSIASQLEEMGCEINDEWFLKNSYMQPFDNFGREEAQQEQKNND